MRFFRHRRHLRKSRIPVPMGDPTANTMFGKSQSGMFTPAGPARGRFPSPNPWVAVDKSVDKYFLNQVVNPTTTSKNGVVKEGVTVKSYRTAMALALLTELAEAQERHGDTDGTRRLQAMVARMVAELLYR